MARWPCHGASWRGGCFLPRALYYTKNGPALPGQPCTDKPWRGERGGLSGLARSGNPPAQAATLVKQASAWLRLANVLVCRLANGSGFSPRTSQCQMLEVVLGNLQGSKCFATLDMNPGYWQFP